MATSHSIGSLYNSLTAGSKIIGTVIADSDFRVDGIIEGDIQCKGKIVIGEKGAVQGDVVCQNADILGCVEGGLHVENTLALRASGSINGDVQTKILVVEPKAQFNGSCSMKREGAPEPQIAEEPAAKPEPKAEKTAEPKNSKTKDEKPKAKAEPTKVEAPKPAAKEMELDLSLDKDDDNPVLAVNESSIGNGQDENIITFIDDEPEIVAVD